MLGHAKAARLAVYAGMAVLFLVVLPWTALALLWAQGSCK